MLTCSVGTEQSDGIQVTFCGSSFITGQTGELVRSCMSHFQSSNCSVY